MIAYVDSSVLLRVALAQPNALPEWRRIDRGVSSALITTESLRTLMGSASWGPIQCRDRPHESHPPHPSAPAPGHLTSARGPVSWLAGVGRAVAASASDGGSGGKSGLRRIGCQVTPGGREPTESATESRPPKSLAGPARVKRCGKSAPRQWQHATAR